MARKQAVEPIPGYSQEDIDSFVDWVPDLIEAIKDGVLDTHLRSIARACFDRREATGGNTGTVKETSGKERGRPKVKPKPGDDDDGEADVIADPDGPPAIKSARRRGYRRKENNAAIEKAKNGEYVMLTRNIMPVSPDDDDEDEHLFMLDGACYRKRDFVGKAMIPASVSGERIDWAVGVLILIEGVGTRSVKFKFIEKPRGTDNSKAVEAWMKNEPLWLTKNILLPYVGKE